MRLTTDLILEMLHRFYPLSRLEEGELLLCPFCGSNAAWSDGEQKTEYGNDQVYCPNCYASTAPDLGKEAAAAWWNTRASQPQAERDAVFRQAIAIARNPHLKNSLWSKEQDKAAGQVQERIAVALEYARRGQNYRNSLSQPQATGESVWDAAITVAQQSVKSSQAAHLDIAAAEILIRRLEAAKAAHPVEQGEDEVCKEEKNKV